MFKQLIQETGWNERMTLLIVAILLTVILAIVGEGQAMMAQRTFISENTESYLSVAADEGAALYAACSNSSVSPGNYTPANFNIGMSNLTPFGNSWGCVKVAGGVYGNPVTTVMFLSAPSVLPGNPGSNLTTNTTLQENIASEIAEALTDRVTFSPNTVVGVIQAGNKTMNLLGSWQQMIPVLNTSLAYATPAIVGNLYGTTPTNNVAGQTP